MRVRDLIEKPFSRYTFKEQLEVINSGKPKPELPFLKTEQKKGCSSFTRRFHVSQYENISWLTGCGDRGKLFCWPCLLFVTEKEKSIWNDPTQGYDDLNNLMNSVKKHERSQSHISSSMKLKKFGKRPTDLQLKNQIQTEVMKHNEMVVQNRNILKRFIDAVCYLGVHELAFPGHSENVDSDNRGNYVDLLDFLSKYDIILKTHLETSTTFRGSSNRIQYDLISSVQAVVLMEIKEEIKKAKYVAILLDETSDISSKSQLCVVLRYVCSDTAKARERFIEFIDVSADRSADSIFAHVKRIVEDYDLTEKLVVQSYDGAAVMACQVGDLRAKVQELYPKALFVHCSSHSLNFVLSQSASNIQECRIFFRTLSGLGAFFNKSTKRAHALSEFTTEKMPNVPTQWNFSSRIITTVKEYYDCFTKFFENLIENSEHWDTEAIVSAQGFLKFLSEAQTLFFIEIFSILFLLTDVLYDILQENQLDILYCLKQVQETRDEIEKYKNDLIFEDIWNYANSKSEEFVVRKRRKLSKPEDEETRARALFNEIFDSVLTQLNERFGNLDKLKFLSLLDTSRYDKYKRNFPTEIALNLKECYGKLFDDVKLKNQLLAVYVDADLKNMNPYVLVETVKASELDEILSEVYKLGILILTIPSTTASVENSFSALKRIKSYQKSTQGQERVSGLSLMSIEKTLLNQLQNNPMGTFYDLVVTEFVKLDGRMDFVFM